MHKPLCDPISKFAQGRVATGAATVTATAETVSCSDNRPSKAGISDFGDFYHRRLLKPAISSTNVSWLLDTRKRML